MKAKKAPKPRVLKTHRFQQTALKKLEKIAKKKNMSPSEVLEILIFDYND